ncbi:MAG TPA: Coenzyme F420 hydrogenase/dehydrogenase, beta subunit C-terminal domain [Victivallales bacterium]|nr:Coenzyme F420 hydrogenase/dehydrogenase, beta subunit C-terminal domain [Victivallales bacterium]
MDLETKLRETARALLEKKEVDTVIGYEKDDMPLRMVPCFISKPEDVGRLVWNPLCENNLTKYLVKRAEKTAVIAKSCDVKSIIVLINEKQIKRDKIIIIGMPCNGVIDRQKIHNYLDNEEINEAEIGDNIIKIKCDDFIKDLKISDFIHKSCLECQQRNPVLFDIFIGNKAVEIESGDEYAEIKELENKTAQERWEYFKKELSKCNRCYACRQACPLCYCKSCFVDQNFPAWFGKGTEISDTISFHLLRALHTTGRCVDCAACERACPQNIKLRMLTKKIEKDIKELFGSEAGLEIGEATPLTSFDENDPQEFIV